MFDRSHADVNPVIAKRRELENKRATLQQTLSSNNKLSHIAHWEVTNERVQAKQHVKKHVSASRAAAEENLNARRNKLRTLLAQDEDRFKAEIVALQETPQQQAERMQKKAQELKKAKEERRKKYVQEAYYRKWRAENDDLRTIDSKKSLEYVLAERSEQREARQAMLEKQQQEEQKWAQLWEEDRQKKVKRADADSLRSHLFNTKTKEELEAQKRDLQLRREDEKRMRQHEIKMFKQQMELEAELERQAEVRRLEDQQRKMQEVAHYNAVTEARRREEQALRAQEDIMMLQENLEAHRKETEQARENKLRMRYEAEAYRQFLAERKAVEAKMEQDLERLIQQELDRVNAEQDRKRNKEVNARAALMDEVSRARRQQLLEKELEYELALQQKRTDRDAIEADLRRYKEEQQQIQHRKKQEEMERGLVLDQQIQAVQSYKEQKRLAMLEEEKAAQSREQIHKIMWEKEQEAVKLKDVERDKQANARRSFARRTAGPW